MVRAKSGLMVDAYFSATKYKWILDTVPDAREKMQQALLAIHAERRCGVLFVTHSIDEALAIADRIVILENHQAKKVYPVGSRWRASSSEEDRRALREDILSSIELS